jgi:hypothetical protein
MAVYGHDWIRLKPSKSSSQFNAIDSKSVKQLGALFLTVATQRFTASVTQEQATRYIGSIEIESDCDLDNSYDSYFPVTPRSDLSVRSVVTRHYWCRAA